MCMAAVRELNHRDIVHTGFSSSDFPFSLLFRNKI